MKSIKKICFAASSGGHLEEISKLSPLVKEKDFLFTEKNNFNNVLWCKNIFCVPQINRKEIFFIPKFFNLCIISFFVLLKEKPDVIISTGALVTFPISIIGKFLGKKIIYIESFARIDSASLTGKLFYKIADIFIVQWEEMLKIFPRAIYAGGIF